MKNVAMGVYFFLAFATLWAKPVSKEDLIKVQSKLREAESLSVNFNHSMYSALRRKKTKAHHGLAYFGKLGEFKWVQLSPLRVEFIFNGKELFQYFPEEKRALKFSAGDEISRRFSKISDLVLNIHSLFDEYEMVTADLDEKNHTINVELKPKSTQGDLSLVNLGISKQPNFVKLVKLTYADGKQYEYEFNSPKFDSLTPDTFSFVLPKNVKLEVLR